MNASHWRTIVKLFLRRKGDNTYYEFPFFDFLIATQPISSTENDCANGAILTSKDLLEILHKIDQEDTCSFRAVQAGWGGILEIKKIGEQV